MEKYNSEKLTARLIGFGFTVERINSVLTPPRYIVKDTVDWRTGKLLPVPVSQSFGTLEELSAFVDKIVEDRKFIKLEH